MIKSYFWVVFLLASGLIRVELSNFAVSLNEIQGTAIVVRTYEWVGFSCSRDL